MLGAVEIVLAKICWEELVARSYARQRVPIGRPSWAMGLGQSRLSQPRVLRFKLKSARGLTSVRLIFKCSKRSWRNWNFRFISLAKSLTLKGMSRGSWYRLRRLVWLTSSLWVLTRCPRSLKLVSWRTRFLGAKALGSFRECTKINKKKPGFTLFKALKVKKELLFLRYTNKC